MISATRMVAAMQSPTINNMLGRAFRETGVAMKERVGSIGGTRTLSI